MRLLKRLVQILLTAIFFLWLTKAIRIGEEEIIWTSDMSFEDAVRFLKMHVSEGLSNNPCKCPPGSRQTMQSIQKFVP